MPEQLLSYATPAKRNSWWALTFAVNLVGVIGYFGTALSVNMLGAGIILLFTRRGLWTLRHGLFLTASAFALAGSVSLIVVALRWADRIGLTERQRSFIFIPPGRKQRLVITRKNH